MQFIGTGFPDVQVRFSCGHVNDLPGSHQDASRGAILDLPNRLCKHCSNGRSSFQEATRTVEASAAQPECAKHVIRVAEFLKRRYRRSGAVGKLRGT